MYKVHISVRISERYPLFHLTHSIHNCLHIRRNHLDELTKKRSSEKQNSFAFKFFISYQLIALTTYHHHQHHHRHQSFEVSWNLCDLIDSNGWMKGLFVLFFVDVAAVVRCFSLFMLFPACFFHSLSLLILLFFPFFWWSVRVLKVSTRWYSFPFYRRVTLCVVRQWIAMNIVCD